MIRLIVLAALLAASFGTSLQAQQAEILGETNPLAVLTGNRFDGAWWVTIQNGVPGVFVFNRAGTFSTSFASDAGGHFPVGAFLPINGIWVRRGAREAEAFGARFVVGEDDKILSAERVRFTLRFGADFSSLEGEFALEEVFCESVPVPPGGPITDLPSCPDLTTAPTERLREGTITAKRLTFESGR